MQYSDELLAAIESYLGGKATEAEVEMVNDWYHSFDDAEVDVDVNADLNAEVGADVDDADYGKLVEARLRLRIYKSAGIEAPKQRRLWPGIRVAAGIAAAVAVVVFGIWFYSGRDQQAGIGTGSIASVNDIAPGKRGATLRLANGEVIALSDAKSGLIIKNGLKYSDGTAVQGSLSSRANAKDLIGSSELGMTNERGRAQSLTASTGRGQTYQFTLPDGTKVWLNAESKLEFPSSFVKSKTRNVKLSGEGYFEVAKDKAHAFIVEGGGQRVEVLGTHFNMSSYADETSTETTLLEGSVNVNGTILKPKQQAITRDGTIKVREANIEEAIAWKDELFRFDKTELAVIMRQIGRWYDLDVVYKGAAGSRTFSGLIRRDVKLSQILRILETGGIKFRIEEPLKAGGAKRIVVMQ